MRSLAVIAGALLIGAAAHVAIMATGGYEGPTAPITAAVAFGLVVGAVCIGRAWRERRFVVAWCLVAALMAAEAYAIILTAERVVAAREAAQAPIREAEAIRLSLVDRLERAEAAKKTVDAAAVEKVAERHCAQNCRALLQDQIASAQAEVEAAREALAALKPPASATPLADRIGIAGWAFDLITAALASIAANGLGAALVAFGAHGARREAEAPAAEEKPQAVVVEPPKALPAPSPLDQVARFGREMMTPADASISIPKLYASFVDWSSEHGLRALSPTEAGGAMNVVFATAGLSIEHVDGVPHVRGAKLKAASTKRGLGNMRKSA